MGLETALELRKHGQHEEAHRLLVLLAGSCPHDAVVQYETACVHDYLGLESEAVSYYEKALAGNLPSDKRRSAFLGLGSTYRTLGLYENARHALVAGLVEFPNANEIKVFLAMTQHNLGQSKTAIETLLALLAATSNDAGIQAYARAIEFYAQDIEQAWPEDLA